MIDPQYLRAMIVSARLEMFIAFPPELKESLDADRSATEAGLAMIPGYARPRCPAFHEFAPQIAAFEAVLPWDAIRAEFARKAKKIGLSAASDVSIKPERDGLVLWCEARGRA